MEINFKEIFYGQFRKYQNQLLTRSISGQINPNKFKDFFLKKNSKNRIMSQIQLDYTSKDFLAKLSIESSPSLAPKNLRLSNQHQLTSPHKEMVSPKTGNLGKIQFKTLSSSQNTTRTIIGLQSPKKSQQISTIQIIKRNLPAQKKFNPEDQTEVDKQRKIFSSNYFFETERKFYEKNFNQNSDISEGLRQKENSKTVSSEQDLIFKKTEIILKVLLKSQMKSFEIKYITNQLKKGLENSYEFDEIIETQGKKKNQNESRNKVEKLDQREIKHNSLSLNHGKEQKASSEKRLKSSRKYLPIEKTKKQMKHLASEIKSEILKQVKKMKYEVLVNEKSLKLSKKLSLK